MFFYFFIKKLTPQTDWNLPFWGTLLFAINPSFIASAVNPNIDFPVLVFFIWTIWALFYNRLVVAALFGIFTIFSKDPGILAYSLLIFFWFIIYIIYKNKQDLRVKIKKLFILLAPVALFLFYLYWRKTHHSTQLFINLDAVDMIKMFLNVKLTEPHMIADAVASLGIHFQWILTLSFLLFPLIYLFKRNDIIWKENFFKKYFRHYVFISCILLTFMYFFFRFPHYTNVRYFILITPILITAGVLCWELSSSNRKIKIILSSIMAVLFFISLYNSIDPVGRLYFGTFNYGNKKFYNMTSVKIPEYECCGYGRDQIAYNLQFTQIHYLTDKILSEIPINTTIVIPQYAYFSVFNHRNPLNGRRSMFNINDNAVAITWAWDLFLKNKNFPEEIYAVDQPNLTDHFMRDILTSKLYTPIEEHIVQQGDYIVKYWKLKRNY